MPTPEAVDRRRMPPWLPRAFMLAAATVALFVAVVWVALRLRGLLLLLLIAMFLALAIEPAVNKLASHGCRRGAATGLVFLALGILTALFFAVLGSLLVSQVTTLVHGIPGYAQHLVGWANRTFRTHVSQADIGRQLSRTGGLVSGHLSALAGNAWGIGTTALGAVFQSFAVLLFAYYLAAEAPRVRRTICSVLPPHRQREVLRAWEIAVDKTGGYIYSRALLAIASGVAHWIVLSLLGVPFAFALALWVGVVSQFIPTIGTYLAGILPLLVAVAKSPLTALWVLLFILGYQQFENYVLQPHITARTVDIHPAVAFAAVIAGAALLGPIGAVLAIPGWASLQSFAKTYIHRYGVEEHRLTTGTPEPEKRAKHPKPRRPPWRRPPGDNGR
ncbi:MAG: yhhT 3 [Streptosporangiaceae bacterium]|jgi:predicted PurR-regulated permease PerM|nr:yhhT 3 [Streptosporangiaceae bacterium]